MVLKSFVGASLFAAATVIQALPFSTVAQTNGNHILNRRQGNPSSGPEDLLPKDSKSRNFLCDLLASVSPLPAMDPSKSIENQVLKQCQQLQASLSPTSQLAPTANDGTGDTSQSLAPPANDGTGKRALLRRAINHHDG